jgi:hypothetical protein
LIARRFSSEPGTTLQAEWRSMRPWPADPRLLWQLCRCSSRPRRAICGGSAAPGFRSAGIPQRRGWDATLPLPRSRCSGTATPARQSDRRERPVDAAAWKSGAPHCQWLYGFLHRPRSPNQSPRTSTHGCDQAVGQPHYRPIWNLSGLISSRRFWMPASGRALAPAARRNPSDCAPGADPIKAGSRLIRAGSAAIYNPS